MGAAVERSGDEFDRTALPGVVRHAIVLGVIEAIVVVLLSVITRLTGGIVEAVIGGIVLVIGLALVSMLPGLWTRARSIEGIAGAAGIGLAAAVVFLLVDVSILQPLGIYTNRWREIGGGSNWWYHPVWWMVGTFLPWMGALILTAQADRGREPSLVTGMVPALLAAVVIGAIAAAVHFPGAGWSFATFGIAFLPGIAAAAALMSLRSSRT